METPVAESVLSRPRFAGFAFAVLIAITASAFGAVRSHHRHVMPHEHGSLPSFHRCSGGHHWR